jgi:hypothetical protein
MELSTLLEPVVVEGGMLIGKEHRGLSKDALAVILNIFEG